MYYVYWNGKKIAYKTITSARKNTLARMDREWVHTQAIFNETASIGEIHNGNSIMGPLWYSHNPAFLKGGIHVLNRDGTLGNRLS